jgi:DNA-binding NtrC family response regulator
MRFSAAWERFVEGRIRDGTQALYSESVTFLEPYLIDRVLHHSGGDIDRAAETLGLSRSELENKINNRRNDVI